MSYETFQLTPVTPVIDAEIDGLDLRQPLSEPQRKELHHVLLHYHVLFFRDQTLDFEQHKRLGSYFGELHVHPNAPAGPTEGHPEILRIHADDNTKRIAGDMWHSDVSCEGEPPMGSYDALSEPMKVFLENLTAIHDGAPNYGNRNELQGIDNTGRVFPRAEHPLIRTHPETGRKAIFVNPAFTTGIKELPRAEEQAILQFLYQHNALPQFHCRFKWQPNSMAFWDNRCVQHHAMWDYYPQVHSGYRVTIRGDKPY